MASYEGIIRGIFGMLVLLTTSYLLSSNRKAINWRTVGVGLFLQFFLALLILKVSFFKNVFDSIAGFF
ncbi:MAG: hypothetical protein RJA52_1186, partial [Bacteroidota bacterium]